MQLQALTDTELVQHIWVKFDPLVNTELDQELTRRFEAKVAEADAIAPIQEFLDEHYLDADDLLKVLKLLEEFNATDLQTLRQKLERADKFYDIANEAGDLFSRLNDLTHETL